MALLCRAVILLYTQPLFAYHFDAFEKIDPEISTVLNAIAEVAKRTTPVTDEELP